MDVRNLSNQESPLYNTLTRKTERDPWTYNLLSSVGSFSKQRVAVVPDVEVEDFKSKPLPVVWNLPRYGLLGGLMIRSVIQVASTHSGNFSKEVFVDNLGAFLFNEISIRTNNKMIQTLYPEYTLARIKELPYEKRKSMESAIGSDGLALTSQVSDALRTFVVYTPCFFSFMERTNTFLDTRFVEDLQIHATVEQGNRLTDSATCKFVPGQPELVCTFYNPTDLTYNRVQSVNYSNDSPSTFLTYDTFRETPVEKTGATGSTATEDGHEYKNKQTMKLKVKNPNLTFATHIFLRKKQDPTLTPVPLKSRLIAGKLFQAGGLPAGGNTDSASNMFRCKNDEEDFPFVDGDILVIDGGGTIGDLTLGTPSNDQCMVINSTPRMFQLAKVKELTAVVTKTFAAVTDADDTLQTREYKPNKAPGDFLPIQKITVTGSSREIMSSPAYELQHLDTAQYGRLIEGDQRVSAGAEANLSKSDNIYTIHWGIDASRSNCSGACSYKNMTNPEISIEFDIPAGNTDKYELIVMHEFFQIMSIQGSDGRIALGISV